MLNNRLIQELARLEQRDIERETYDVFAPAYGMIYVNDGVVAQAGITVPEKLTGFAANGISLNTTPDHTDDSITVTHAGIYDVEFQLSFSGTANTEFDIYVRVDGVEQPNAGTHRHLGGGGDVGSCSTTTQLSLAASEVLTLYVEKVGGGAGSITMIDCQLKCTRIF